MLQCPQKNTPASSNNLFVTFDWYDKSGSLLYPVFGCHTLSPLVFLQSSVFARMSFHWPAGYHSPLPPYGFLLYLQLVSDRKSTRLNSSHVAISYAVFCLKKKKIIY